LSPRQRLHRWRPPWQALYTIPGRDAGIVHEPGRRASTKASEPSAANAASTLKPGT
jgi:hypothetical protein